MSGIATAVVGGAVIGGIASNMAAGKAADATTQAADSANATQLQMYNQTREDQAPWRQVGQDALNQLAQRLGVGGDSSSADYGNLAGSFNAGNLASDPGYQFRISQGQNQIESSAAARGGLLSGAAAKALTQYNQGFASNEYQNAYNRFTNDQTNAVNRLASLAGVGQIANNQVQQAGQNTANQVSQNQLYAGTQRASGYANVGNSISSGIGTATNALMNYGRPSYQAYTNNPYGNYQATSSGVDMSNFAPTGYLQ